MLKVIFITRNINVDCRTISCSVYCTIVYILWIWRATCSFCQSPCYFVGQKVSVRTIFECSLFSTFKGKIINTSLYPFCFQFVIFVYPLQSLSPVFHLQTNRGTDNPLSFPDSPVSRHRIQCCMFPDLCG